MGIEGISTSALYLISILIILLKTLPYRNSCQLVWRVWGEAVLLFFILWEIAGGPQDCLQESPCSIPQSTTSERCDWQWISSLPERCRENIAGLFLLSLFLSVSQQDEVMTEWQVYLGFPCLASSLNIPGFNVCGYHTDISGLGAMLAPPLPLSGARWYSGEGEVERGKVCTPQVTVFSVGTSSAFVGSCCL